MPRCCRCCLMTAAAKPGRREGGVTMDFCARDLVLMAGGATRAAAVATWALVRARGDVLLGVAALRSRATLRFRMRSRLADSVGMFVGGTGLCTLGTDGCAIMERVILLVLLDMPCNALTQSANACITLSAWVMVGLVMRLCWNWTVSDSRSLLVCLM